MADNVKVPTTVYEPTLEQKLDGLDDHLQPIKEDLVENEKPEEPPKDDNATIKEAEESPEEEKPVSDEPASEEEAEDGKEPADDGYTIDEGEDEAEPPETATTESASNKLTPEQQYILDGLSPITVRGTVGTSQTIKEYQALSPEQLPSGFKFVDEREMAIAAKQFTVLENQATQRQNDFRNQQTQQTAKEFKEREDNADRADIGQLQRNGDIPRFKTDPDDPKFTADPAAVLIQEVLDFKEKQNAQYMEEYNAGRPYKHIGFNEAFAIFRRENPSKTSSAQAKEDKERLDVAKRTTGSKSETASAPQKPRVHSGMDSMDLERMIENLNW